MRIEAGFLVGKDWSEGLLRKEMLVKWMSGIEGGIVRHPGIDFGCRGVAAILSVGIW